MWKNSLKNVEPDNNKILYETLLDFFTAKRYYFLNKPRNNVITVNTYIQQEFISINVFNGRF